MSPRGFVQSGTHESTKGLFHLAAAGLCAVLATYNIAAWCYRRDPHLRWNAVIYTLATGWEVEHTYHHFHKH